MIKTLWKVLPSFILNEGFLSIVFLLFFNQRLEPLPPEVEVQSLNHWTAGEFPKESSKKIIYCLTVFDHSCNTQGLQTSLWRMGSNVLPREQTLASCIGSVES